MTETTTDDPDGIARRAFLRRLGATGIAATGVAAGASHADVSPAQDADALGVTGAILIGAAGGAAITYAMTGGGDGEKEPEDAIDDAETINNWHSLYSAD